MGTKANSSRWKSKSRPRHGRRRRRLPETERMGESRAQREPDPESGGFFSTRAMPMCGQR